MVSNGGLRASETREAVDIEIIEMKRIEVEDFDFSNTIRRYDNVELGTMVNGLRSPLERSRNC